MISRRSILKRGATVAALAGTAVAAVSSAPTEAPATELVSEVLADAIRQHVAVYAEWNAAIVACGVLDKERFAEVRLARANGATEAECNALKAASRETVRYRQLWNAQSDACDREGKAIEAVIDAPVRNLTDLRAKLDYLMSMPDGDESFGNIDDRLTRFMQAIMAGGIISREVVREGEA